MGSCSDGAASMTDRQILHQSPEAKWAHSYLHHERLVAKNMSPEFQELMDISGKNISCTNSNVVNS